MSELQDFPQDGLSDSELERLFPFHIVVDSKLRIVHAGTIWRKYLNIEGKDFFECFELLRPKLLEPDLVALQEKHEEPVMLKLRKLGAQFRGELLPRRKHFIMMLTPLVQGLDKLKGIGVSVKDLALHDSTAEIFSVVQSQASYLNDARELTKKLKERRRELVEAKSEVESALVEAEDAKLVAEEAQQSAESTAEAKHQFLAAMSHELRTPLNGVLGMAQILRDTKLDAEQHRFLNTLSRSGDSLLEIINDILDFSKIESGNLELEQRDFDPRLMLEDVADMLSSNAHKKDVELVAWADESVPSLVVGDVTRLKQVMINLASNAIKFTKEGHVGIRLRYEDDWLLGEIQDSGIGIKDSAIGGLFNAFSQADSSTTRQFGGTGLGLSISRQLCEAMGGSVKCTSVFGEGSTFSFRVKLPSSGAYSRPSIPWDGPVAVVGERTRSLEDWTASLESLGAEVESYSDVRDLPDKTWHGVLMSAGTKLPDSVPKDRVFLLANLADALEASRAAAELGGYFTRPCRASMLQAKWDPALKSKVKAPVGELPPPGLRVLLVEDNKVNQTIAGAFLRKMKVDFEVANHGEEALGILNGLEFDIVLMDCQMPVMDGFEATRQIRRLHGNDLPVLAMTANVLPEDKQRCMDSGMDDYIAKPIVFQVLADKLSLWHPDRRRADLSA